MSEPEQPEPEVAEAGPGNAGNACFVRLMPDLLQLPSTDIHGQNVTVYTADCMQTALCSLQSAL